MRVRSLRRLTLSLAAALGAVGAAGAALAQGNAGTGRGTPATGGVEVRIDAPAHLAVGDRAGIVLHVHLQPDDHLPVLVTPTSEGTAIEVVRGRLLRADAHEEGHGRIRFDVPIVARGAGTSIFRANVRAYVCGRRCRSVEGAASAVLEVQPAGAGTQETVHSFR